MTKCENRHDLTNGAQRRLKVQYVVQDLFDLLFSLLVLLTE